MKSNKTDVLVAGAGPVGLTAALFLHQQGMQTVLVDAKPRGVTHSYALALHPASLDLLQGLGVLEEVLPTALLVRDVAIHAGERRLLAAPVAGEDARHPYLAVLGQDTLENALAQALARQGAQVDWNHRLARFVQDTSGVVVEIDELEERVVGYAAARFDWMVRRSRAVEASFIIGADGHDSLVRRQLNLGFPEVAPAEHFAVFEFQTDRPLAREVVLVLHEDGPGVLWPLPGGRARWSFAVDPAQYPEALREKNHEPVQIVGPGAYPVLEESFFQRLLAERAPWFGTQTGHVYWRMLVRFERRLADAFGTRRVWLAGDAAHLTGPAGIQSMNVGLREARDLARLLVRASAARASIDGIGAYETERQAEWRQLLGLGGGVTALPGAAPEIARFKDRLPACLPASGDALVQLAARCGLGI